MKGNALARAFRRSLVAFAATVCVSTTAMASYSQVVFFGDSLSDTGNLYAATGIPVSPPYYNGRFSNGPVWTETLAASLGLAATPSLYGGTNYAWAGATVLDFGRPMPELPQQLGQYLLGSSGAADPNTLYVILGGANDISDIMTAYAMGGTFASAVSQAEAAAAAVDAMVQALYDAGARNVLVGDLPDIGLTPRAKAAGAAGLASYLTNVFNAQLLGLLGGTEAADLGLDLDILDLYGLMNTAIADGTFANTTDPCFTGSAELGGGTVCASPDSYLFWDSFHPSAAAHGMIADTALRALPEPAGLFLVLIAAAGLVWSRSVRGRASLRPC
jgi:phospholipase/lecithinase/hemolysin